MRTVRITVEIAEELARDAKAHAARENTSLRELFERGLRMVTKKDEDAAGFTLRDASVGGRGLHDDFRDCDWARLRAAAYGDRGG